MSSGIQGGGDSTSTGLAGDSHPVESASSAFSTGREKSKYQRKKVYVKLVCSSNKIKGIRKAAISKPTVKTLNNGNPLLDRNT
jgi:hypothetical protein